MFNLCSGSIWIYSGGLRARSKEQGLGPCRIGVRGFESHPPHHTETLLQSKIFKVVWNLRKRGYAESTLRGYSKKLRLLGRSVSLDNPESVNRFLANKQNWKNSFKQTVVNAYLHYVRYYGLSWKKPKFRRSARLPYVPTSEQVEKLIAHSNRKYAMIYSILRDTGLRPIELHRLTLSNIDLENGIIYPESAKGGHARALTLKVSTLAMLKEFVRKNNFGLDERMFPSTTIMSHIFIRTRNRLAERLCELQLKKFRLYDLRHYYATMLYHKTKDILLVKEKLGHRRLETTLVYTHLVDFRDEEFTVRATSTVAEASKLIESGFEFVNEIDGTALYRKRK
jgi:integrase/recombinase XerD